MVSSEIKFHPYPYQQKAIDWIIDKPKAGLFLSMGLGKTVSTLTAIDELMFDRLEVSKVLVIAPLRVADTVWQEETEKWEHLNHFRCSKILGTRKERLKALEADADIYIINRENVPWLIGSTEFDFDMVVIDELSSFKNPSAKRFKALKKRMGRAKRVVGLTGTPSPKGLIDLWSQVYLLDQGRRLGKTVTGYRNNYFIPASGSGHIVYTYALRKGAGETIQNSIKDICFSMDIDDYLTMPPRIEVNTTVRLSPKEMAKYEELKKHFAIELAGEDISAVNQAVLIGKLQQFASGAIYNDLGGVEIVSEAKLEALREAIEAANGAPVLVFYNYRHERDRILEAVKGSKELVTSDDIRAWNRGEIGVLVCHPASAGHGLNLQAGGSNIIWFGLNWSLELYQQANARLYRQGQKNPVVINHLVVEGTVDEQVLKALQEKKTVQDLVLESLKA